MKLYRTMLASAIIMGGTLHMTPAERSTLLNDGWRFALNSDSHKAWKGRAPAAVKSNGKKGSANIRISSPGLKTNTIKLKFK